MRPHSRSVGADLFLSELVIEVVDLLDLDERRGLRGQRAVDRRLARCPWPPDAELADLVQDGLVTDAEAVGGLALRAAGAREHGDDGLALGDLGRLAAQRLQVDLAVLAGEGELLGDDLAERARRGARGVAAERIAAAVARVRRAGAQR